MGMPLPSGFPGELLILVAAITTHAGTGLAALAGSVIGAAAFLDRYRRAFFGPVLRGDVSTLPDLRPRELAIVLVFASVIVAAGVAPAQLLELMRSAGEAWVARLR
jgi:NADH-quinone oxidoreductase subunit M